MTNPSDSGPDGTPSGIYRAARPIVLASASPRRKELMASLGVEFRVKESNVDEPAPQPGQSPTDYALAMARLKARDVAGSVLPEKPDAVVLGADTIVVLPDENGGLILGKPRDQADALDMLTRLSGQTHEVITGCCLVSGQGETGFHGITRVRMRASSQAELAAYIRSDEPMDKAGAYAIQGLAACLVSHVEGSYTNVVGLPLALVLEELLCLNALAPKAGGET